MQHVRDITIVVATSLLVGAIFVVAGHNATIVRAQEHPALSEAHTQRIVANCVSAKASLQQLRSNDVSLRVNRGQLYEYISAKLMARFNGRAALNRLNNAQMVTSAAEFERLLANFRVAYQHYATAVTDVLETDCRKNPQDFYYRVIEARDKRSEVHQLVLRLAQGVNEYHGMFIVLMDDYTRALNGLGGEANG